jgi:hypothetical protein
VGGAALRRGGRAAAGVVIAAVVAGAAHAAASPAAPTGLRSAAATTTSIRLAWTAGRGAAGYGVYLNGARVAQVRGTSYAFTGLTCGRTYALGVAALDARGHRSRRVTLRTATAACPPPGLPDPPAPPAVAPSVFLSPNGSDSNPCSAAAPCLSLNRAYHAVRSGGRVELAAGLYGCDDITPDPSKTKFVVFAPAAGASVSTTCELSIDGNYIEFDNLNLAGIRTDSAQHLTLRNVNVTCQDVAPYTLYAPGLCSAGVFVFAPASYFSMIGGSVGPTWDAPGAPGQSQVGIALGAVSGPSQNLLFDGVHFHDNRRSDDLQHTSCLMLGGGQNVTIRNSSFDNCAVFDLFVTWWNFVQPQYPVATNVVIDHNTFARAVAGCAGCQSGYFSVEFADYPPVWQDILVSNNTAYQSMHFDGAHANFVVSGNKMPMLSYDCPKDITFRRNLSNDGGPTCG